MTATSTTISSLPNATTPPCSTPLMARLGAHYQHHLFPSMTSQLTTQMVTTMAFTRFLCHPTSTTFFPSSLQGNGDDADDGVFVFGGSILPPLEEKHKRHAMPSTGKKTPNPLVWNTDIRSPPTDFNFYLDVRHVTFINQINATCCTSD